MIWDAYTQLLKEKGLSRITVADIVTRADLNWATFYAHYPDVRGVTEEIENELIAKMPEVLEEFRYTQLFPQSGPAAEAQPLSGGGRGLLPHAGARQRLRALHGKAEKVFTDHMLHDSDIPDDMRHSKMVSLRICCFVGGIVNLYRQWFRGDLDCTLNDIAMEVSKLLHLKAQELFRT